MEILWYVSLCLSSNSSNIVEIPTSNMELKLHSPVGAEPVIYQWPLVIGRGAVSILPRLSFTWYWLKSDNGDTVVLCNNCIISLLVDPSLRTLFPPDSVCARWSRNFGIYFGCIISDYFQIYDRNSYFHYQLPEICNSFLHWPIQTTSLRIYFPFLFIIGSHFLSGFFIHFGIL